MQWIPRLLLLAFMFRYGNQILPQTVNLRDIAGQLEHVPGAVSYELYAGWVSFHHDCDVISRRIERYENSPLLTPRFPGAPPMDPGAGPGCITSAMAKRSAKRDAT